MTFMRQSSSDVSAMANGLLVKPHRLAANGLGEIKGTENCSSSAGFVSTHSSFRVQVLNDYILFVFADVGFALLAKVRIRRTALVKTQLACVSEGA